MPHERTVSTINLQRVYRDHRVRDAFKVTRRSQKPNVTDELLKLGDLGPKIAAERAPRSII